MFIFSTRLLKDHNGKVYSRYHDGEAHSLSAMRGYALSYLKTLKIFDDVDSVTRDIVPTIMKFENSQVRNSGPGAPKFVFFTA